LVFYLYPAKIKFAHAPCANAIYTALATCALDVIRSGISNPLIVSAVRRRAHGGLTLGFARNFYR